MIRTIHSRGFRCTARFDADGIAASVGAARDHALRKVGEYIRARSVAIAPKRSGQLAASARVESGAGKVTVRYGAAYAAIQHEHTEFHHPNGGQARFLRSVVEDPATINMVERTFADALAKALK